MFVREYGLVQNSSNPERFVRLVKWEDRWEPVSLDMEARFLVPVLWEKTELEVREAGGSVWRFVPTAITELAMTHWRTAWPSDAPTETEELRRERIRALRFACHVNPGKAVEEPHWAAELVTAVQRAAA